MHDWFSHRNKFEFDPREGGACTNVSLYKKIARIGEGTYGTVYKAQHLQTHQVVALKRVMLHNESQEGFPITAIREVKLLKRLNHPNCVRLIDMAVGTKRTSVFLVFEYCEHDLASLIDAVPHAFTEAQVKRILLQILSAIQHLHDQYIIHRDLKMSNLLYNKKGQVKVADFGLAREVGEPMPDLTPKVVTLWYRAPELLLGGTLYTTAIDLWACGCLFAELLLRRPLMPGTSEMNQIELIFKLLGKVNDDIWPGVSTYPNMKSLDFDPSKYQYNNLEKMLPTLSMEGIDLLNQLLTYDPKKRITVHQALEHRYFFTKPYPTDEAMMPTFPSLHDQGNPKAIASETSPMPAKSLSSVSLSSKGGGPQQRRRSNDAFGTIFGS